MEQTVLAAMSGGVDSAAAAYLLKRAGWRCQGVYMCLYPPPAAGALPQDGRDAARIAAQLGIPFAALHAAGEFETQVIQKFVQVYEAGGTPNPCVDCNRCLKFGRLLQEAEARGLACVATGHYAQKIGRAHV